MRPKNILVMDLIEEFRAKNDLHTLEVATIFGAVQCYAKRGYHSYIAINSFPAESFTAEEQAVFDEFYADVLGDKGIIEILEYTALILINGSQRGIPLIEAVLILHLMILEQAIII